MMDTKRMQELAGVPLNEGPPKTTWDNPLVYVWDDKESKDYPESGLVGHMHLTTAQNIHKFKIDGLADELKSAGTGKRIKAGSKWLELSDWTAKEIKAGGQLDEAANEYEKIAQKINSLLSSVGFAGRDVRETKETIDRDKGKGLIKKMKEIENLIPAYVAAAKEHFK